MRKGIIAAALAALLLYPASAPAVSVVSAVISEKEWNMHSGEMAEFEGTVIYEGSAAESPLTLTLSLESTPELTDPDRRVAFASQNGQKLSKNKQKNQYVISGDEYPAFRFTGHLLIPDDTDLTEARVILTVSDREGQPLISVSTGNPAEPAADSSGSRFPDLSRWIRRVLIAAALVWAAALIRITINRQRKRGE